MTESISTDAQPPSGAFHTVGTGAPSADTRPVGDDDLAVFDDTGSARSSRWGRGCVVTEDALLPAGELARSGG